MGENGAVSSRDRGVWSTGVTLLVLVAAIVPPLLLRGWLNRVPHLWDVYFPLLAILAGTFLVKSIQGREGWLSVGTWGLLTAGALCGATFYLFDAPHVFYSLGRGLSIAFVVAQALQVLIEGLSGSARDA